MLLVYIRESRFQAAILKADDVEGYGAAADSARERGYVREPHFVFVLNVWVKGHILHVRARAWHMAVVARCVSALVSYSYSSMGLRTS